MSKYDEEVTTSGDKSVWIMVAVIFALVGASSLYLFIQLAIDTVRYISKLL